jgi:hypothetical protein
LSVQPEVPLRPLPSRPARSRRYESVGYRAKRVLLGPALRTSQLVHERISKRVALAVFSSEMVRPDTKVTVLVRRRRYVGFWRRRLHDQTSAELTKVLGDLDNVNVTIVPYRLRRRGSLMPAPDGPTAAATQTPDRGASQ